MAHEAHTDFSIFCGLIFLLIIDTDPLLYDANIMKWEEDKV